jgi:UDP-GlcNAc:undecaprenyl-phosphate GlcNAc-1-phosphate transferase
MICAIGVLDDKYELDSLTKLAGQVAATGVMVTLGGVQLAAIYVPWGDTACWITRRRSSRQIQGGQPSRR